MYGCAVARAMQLALDSAGANVTEIDYINAHATSTMVGDVSESNAIKLLAGQYAHEGLLVSSTKSMTGHLLGGAGGVESAVCVLSIQNGIVPPTINLDDPDDEAGIDIATEPRKLTPHTSAPMAALNNSFGFGGANVALAFTAV